MSDSVLPAPPATFPDGFLWGAATAAHQVEGGNVNNDHWELEHAQHSPFAEPSGDACGSCSRWREDLDLVAAAERYRALLEIGREEQVIPGNEKGLLSQAFSSARATGLEPATTGSTVRYSNQLSYAPKLFSSTSLRHSAERGPASLHPIF